MVRYMSSAHVREIILTKFQKTGIREKLDPRNISAIRYTVRFSLFLSRHITQDPLWRNTFRDKKAGLMRTQVCRNFKKCTGTKCCTIQYA